MPRLACTSVGALLSRKALWPSWRGRGSRIITASAQLPRPHTLSLPTMCGLGYRGRQGPAQPSPRLGTKETENYPDTEIRQRRAMQRYG